VDPPGVCVGTGVLVLVGVNVLDVLLGTRVLVLVGVKVLDGVEVLPGVAVGVGVTVGTQAEMKTSRVTIKFFFKGSFRFPWVYSDSGKLGLRRTRTPKSPDFGVVEVGDLNLNV
jgi:hypothetical protein